MERWRALISGHQQVICDPDQGCLTETFHTGRKIVDGAQAGRPQSFPKPWKEKADLKWACSWPGPQGPDWVL